jgi:hypothetical protein
MRGERSALEERTCRQLNVWSSASPACKNRQQTRVRDGYIGARFEDWEPSRTEPDRGNPASSEDLDVVATHSRRPARSGTPSTRSAGARTLSTLSRTFPVTIPRSQGISGQGAASSAKRAHPGDPASEARRLRRVVRACGRAPMPTASLKTPGVGIERPMRARRVERGFNPKERSAAFRERGVAGDRSAQGRRQR